MNCEEGLAWHVLLADVDSRLRDRASILSLLYHLTRLSRNTILPPAVGGVFFLGVRFSQSPAFEILCPLGKL